MATDFDMLALFTTKTKKLMNSEEKLKNFSFFYPHKRPGVKQTIWIMEPLIKEKPTLLIILLSPMTKQPH